MPAAGLALLIIVVAATIRVVVRKLLSGVYVAGEVIEEAGRAKAFLPQPEKVEFIGEKHTVLRGKFWPGKSDKAIIVVHGIDGPSFEMLPHVAYLHQAGYNVLLYDNRGRGESDGGFSTLGYLEWLDVLNAVSWMRSRAEVNPDKIGLHGLSLGAACVIMAAAKDESIRGVLAESPFISMTIMLAHIANRLTRIPRFLLGRLLTIVFDWSLGTKLRTVDPRAAVAKLSPRPIFIIDAAKDQLFPENTARTVYEAAGPPKTFWQVENAAHANCWHTRPEEFERRALDFWKGVFSDDITSHPMPAEPGEPEIRQQEITDPGTS